METALALPLASRYGLECPLLALMARMARLRHNLACLKNRHRMVQIDRPELCRVGLEPGLRPGSRPDYVDYGDW